MGCPETEPTSHQGLRPCFRTGDLSSTAIKKSPSAEQKHDQEDDDEGVGVHGDVVTRQAHAGLFRNAQANQRQIRGPVGSTARWFKRLGSPESGTRIAKPAPCSIQLVTRAL